jgi:hypothetical protein
MHTSGFYFTGQVNVETLVSAEIQNTFGDNTGIDFGQVALAVSTLFSTIFGRRLGTEDDGTTLRSNAELGIDPDEGDGPTPTTYLPSSTRDLTLTHKMTIKLPILEIPIELRGSEYNFGYAYCGPRMKSLDIYNNLFSTSNVYGGAHPNAQTSSAGADSTETFYITPMTMVNWADHRIIGLNNNLNGTGVQIRDYNVNNLKTYIAHPTEIAVSY